jgi:transcriptional regulator with XRE-family HTH domain
MIGQKIKERRTGMNISLRELGSQTGLSAGFLSQVENDQADPSISSLQKIARALKVPMFTFLDEGNQPEQVVRHTARRQLSFPNPHVQFELLTNDLNRLMAGLLIHLKSGESHHAQQLYKSTEEMMYVISGQMEIRVGENIHRLEPGDSLYYEGAQLVRFTALGPEDLVTLCVITPPAF